jgi:integrase
MSLEVEGVLSGALKLQVMRETCTGTVSRLIAARHGYSTTLQSQGVEVGLVAKLMGPANAAVTLSVYTHALRGGESAVAALEKAYSR